VQWLKAILSGHRGNRQSTAADAPCLGCYRAEVEGVPLTAERIPQRGYFRKPASYYAAMLRKAVALYDARPRPTPGDLELIYPCQVAAEWGLIFAGKDAIPFALELLASPVREARETAASVLAAIGRDEEVVAGLLAAFEAECTRTRFGERGTDGLETLDSMLLALGRLRARKAIPAIAKVLRNPEADGDTRLLAAESLGLIVRRRFDKQPEPIAAALDWLSRRSGGDVS
jgi:hypothetical protein